MKTIQELKGRKAPIVSIDPALNKNSGKIIFTKKLERANEMLKTSKLPAKKP